MFKTAIFPLSAQGHAARPAPRLGLWLGLWLGVALAFGLGAVNSFALAADETEAMLQAKRPAHEQALDRIGAQRLAFQRDLAKREEECLKRFISSGCMDDIRTEHMREMRRFDLEREVELQALRDIDAELRKISRARRIEDKSKAVEKPKGQAGG